MSIYKKDKAIMKTIRISQIENDNWDIDKIHDFLEGNVISIELLKQLYDFMGNYMTIKKDKKEEVKRHRDLIVKIKELVS